MYIFNNILDTIINAKQRSITMRILCLFIKYSFEKNEYFDFFRNMNEDKETLLKRIDIKYADKIKTIIIKEKDINKKYLLTENKYELSEKKIKFDFEKLTGVKYSKYDNYMCELKTKEFEDYLNIIFNKNNSSKIIMNKHTQENNKTIILESHKDEFIKKELIKEINISKDELILKILNKTKKKLELMSIEEIKIIYEKKFEDAKEKIEGYIYLIRPGNYCFDNKNVYKIGKTKNIFQRLESYGKDSELKLCMKCINYTKTEYDLIGKFKSKYKLYYGREYFEGSCEDMIKTIKDHIE